MIDTASCNVAALPSWKYGAVSATLRKGAMRSTQRSSSRSVMAAADIVRALHVRERGVPVAAEQHAVMAADAAGALADREPALLQRRERRRVAGEVAIERRARRDQRPLERRDRLRDVVEVERLWIIGERGLEGRLVPGLAQPLHRLLRQIGRASCRERV